MEAVNDLDAGAIPLVAEEGNSAHTFTSEDHFQRELNIAVFNSAVLHGRRIGCRIVTNAARGRDDAANIRPFATQPVNKNQTAAHLERSGRRVVLMLGPQLTASLATEQRPTILQRWRNIARDKFGRAVRDLNITLDP